MPYKSLSVLTPIFPGEPGLASFIGTKDEGSGSDNWRYKTRKAPVKSSSSTNQHLTFYRLDVLPLIQSTVSVKGINQKENKPLVMVQMTMVLSDRTLVSIRAM